MLNILLPVVEQRLRLSVAEAHLLLTYFFIQKVLRISWTGENRFFNVFTCVFSVLHASFSTFFFNLLISCVYWATNLRKFLR